MHLFFS